MSQSATPNGTQNTAQAGTQAVTLTPEAAAGQSAGGALPTVEVVATTPLGAGMNELDVPSETQSISGQEIENLS